MMNTRRRVALAAAAISVTTFACGPKLRPPAIKDSQIDFEERIELGTRALKHLLELQSRVFEVSYAIRVQGASLCGANTAPILGSLHLGPVKFRGRQIQKLAKRTYGGDEELTITHIVPGSPIAEAGVHPRDLITAVNGRRVRKEKHLERALLKGDGGSIRLSLRRTTEDLQIEMPSVTACSHKAVVKPVGRTTTGNLEKNGFFISLEMVQFVESNDELAVAIGHQLAHKILEDQERLVRKNFGRRSYRKKHLELERAADRLGLCLTARARYDVVNAAAFWERLALEHPWAIQSNPINPVTRGPQGVAPHAWIPNRLPAIRRISDELARGREAAACDLSAYDLGDSG